MTVYYDVMKMLKPLTLILIALSGLLFFGCGKGNDKIAVKNDRPIVINIQPLDNVTNYASAIKEFEQKYLKEIGIENYTIHVLPNRMSPISTMNDAETRNSADKLIKLLHGTTKPGEFTIGITKKDISTESQNNKDCDVLGLSYPDRQKRACITSTYRLKSENDLWKLIAHEFSRAYFSQQHCAADNEKCIMQADKDDNSHLDQKEFLCDSCATQIAERISANQYGIP